MFGYYFRDTTREQPNTVTVKPMKDLFVAMLHVSDGRVGMFSEHLMASLNRLSKPMLLQDRNLPMKLK